MRCFTDLCLNPENPDEVASTALAMGYTSVGLPQRVEKEGLDIVKRTDLDPKNSNELNKNLKSRRWNTEIITVNCRSKSVARQAGKDNRVDLITYPLADRWKQNFLDLQQARLMRDSGCGYLIDLSLLLVDDRYILGKRIEFLKRNTNNALKRDISIVASSCAVDAWGLRDPFGLASLLSLLNVDEDHALEMVSNIPQSLVERNREKLKDSYIVPGVWVIEDE